MLTNAVGAYPVGSRLFPAPEAPPVVIGDIPEIVFELTGDLATLERLGVLQRMECAGNLANLEGIGRLQ